MSSATSIKTSARPAHDSFRPWHFFVLLSLVGATAAVVMARQPSAEHLVLLSFTIAAAGVCATALYGTLAPLVRKDSNPAPYGQFYQENVQSVGIGVHFSL